MSSTALRGRRTVILAVTTFTVGALAAVLPTPVSISASAATTTETSTSAAGAVAAAGLAPATATPASLPAARAVPASRSALRTSAVVPYRYGTANYSKWWARFYMAARYKWTTKRQYVCLVHLWTRESHWNRKAHNRGSGAHGIPQAMPGKKMAKFGKDWRTNPRTQIKWGLHYIKGVYGSPCGAWAHWTRHGWY